MCQVVFEGIRGKNYRGDIAIDDIAFTVGACAVLPQNAVPTLPPTTATFTVPLTVRPKGKFNCDFEIDFCSWTQDSSDKFNWTRHHGRTSSTDTGPTTDHTLKTGTFQIFPCSAYLHMVPGITIGAMNTGSSELSSFKVTPNLRWCPPEKKNCMRAVFTETPTNYLSIERLY